jgi:hypothetical protein
MKYQTWSEFEQDYSVTKEQYEAAYNQLQAACAEIDARTHDLSIACAKAIVGRDAETRSRLTAEINALVAQHAQIANQIAQQQ